MARYRFPFAPALALLATVPFLHGADPGLLPPPPPPPPVFTAQPMSQTIASGDSATLVTSASGAPHYQWFEGSPPTTTNPVGTDSDTFVTGALTSTTTYWVRATNVLHTDSDPATITVTQPVASVDGGHRRCGLGGGMGLVLAVGLLGVGKRRRSGLAKG